MRGLGDILPPDEEMEMEAESWFNIMVESQKENPCSLKDLILAFTAGAAISVNPFESDHQTFVWQLKQLLAPLAYAVWKEAQP